MPAGLWRRTPWNPSLSPQAASYRMAIALPLLLCRGNARPRSTLASASLLYTPPCIFPTLSLPLFFFPQFLSCCVARPNCLHACHRLSLCAPPILSGESAGWALGTLGGRFRAPRPRPRVREDGVPACFPIPAVLPDVCATFGGAPGCNCCHERYIKPGDGTTHKSRVWRHGCAAKRRPALYGGVT